jgi:PKHD-type hydroxylase
MAKNPYTLDEVRKDEVLNFSDWKLLDFNNQKSCQSFYHEENFLSPVEFSNLKHLISTLEPLKSDATIVPRSTRDKAVVKGYRKSKVLFIPRNKNTLWLYYKLGELVLKVNRKMNWDFDIQTMSECIQYAEYDSEYEGFYDWHLDIGDNFTCKRKISISIQLSDESEYEGGELEFKMGQINVQAPKKINSAVLFPSYLLHRVKPVTKGKRRSLVLWISGPKFK